MVALVIFTNRKFGLFDVLREWYASPGFRGCPFINAVLEIADASHQAHHVSINLRESIRQIIMRLATEAGVQTPDTFIQAVSSSDWWS